MEVKLKPTAEAVEEKQNIQDSSISIDYSNIIMLMDVKSHEHEIVKRKESIAQNQTVSDNVNIEEQKTRQGKMDLLYNATKIDDFKTYKQRRYGLLQRKIPSQKKDDSDDEKRRILDQKNHLKRYCEKLTPNSSHKYCCQYCNSIFYSKVAYSVHEVTCTKQLFIREKCVKCSKIFLTHSGLLHHICTKEKASFKCDKCSRIFNAKGELESHITEKQCRNMELFTCDICKSTFTDFNILKRHIGEHLGNPLQCLKCNQCFDSKTSLTDHNCAAIELELSPKVKYTNFPYNQFSNGDDHSLTVQKCSKVLSDPHEDKKMHRDNTKCCRGCKLKFWNDSEYTEHLIKCKNSHKLKYKCGDCGKGFMGLSKLQIHILNVHRGITYECEKCNLKFLIQEERDAHIKTCKEEDPCSCKICGKLFAKKDYLKKHEYIHSNILYRCKFCHCAFMKEKSYRKHIEGMNCSKNARNIRLSEFNYKKCRICNMEFDEEEQLIDHFGADHSGDNPHQCFCCEACLPTFRDLENHIHRHNIQKYTCGLCGKPYTSQEGFRKHRLKHKGAELKCQYCDSEFLNERRFKFHVKTCRKNPESAYHRQQDKPEKDGRSKQSRQLHWESRIIIKRLRGEPNSAKSETEQTRGGEGIINIFNESEADSEDLNVRGWFDSYYRTEEDDFAFGLKRDKRREVASEPLRLRSGQAPDAEPRTEKFITNGSVASCSENSSTSDSSSTSSEEDLPEEVTIDYNPKKCRICHVTFSQEYELLHHFIKLHPKKKAHRCPNCPEECPLFAQLKEHMKTHGIGMGVYNCINCSKRFRSAKKMKRHTIRCKGLNIEEALTNESIRFKSNCEDYCKSCCKSFQTKCGYRRHKHVCKERRKCNKENKKTEEETSGCTPSEAVTKLESPPLEKPTADSSSLLQSKTNSVNTEKNGKESYTGELPADSFSCRLCDKKFQYERGIVMHFKSDHPGQKPLVCHICNMHLADKLKEHLKTHGIGEEFVCELCGKRFNQKFLSKIHEMWHQGVEYKCGNCKQKFLNKEKMDKHVGEGRCSNRQSLMRLPCDICGKSYRSKFGLSKHQITHTPKELRPVKNRMNCEFCGKWFETNNGLQRHRRIHTGERPFCCRFCSKSFVQEGNCKSHERIHTGEQRPRKKKSPGESYSSTPGLNHCLFNGENSNQSGLNQNCQSH